jgi:hypothetical protein
MIAKLKINEPILIKRLARGSPFIFKTAKDEKVVNPPEKPATQKSF